MIAYPNIDPVALQIGPISIHWYGLSYVAAFMTFLLLGKWLAKRRRIPLSVLEIDDLLTYVLFGVIVGGRLGEVIFFHPDYYFSNPLEIVKVWKGGMSFHGGLLGVVLSLIWFAKKRNLPIFLLFDTLAPLAAPGLFFGRIANFINAELIGRPTLVPWAMVFPGSDGVPRHPSQLYEALTEGLLLFIILWFFAIAGTRSAPLNDKKNKKTPPLPSRHIPGSKPRGMVFGLFLLLYGLFRFIIEYTRTPDSFMGIYPFGLSMGQFLCVPMIIVGIVLIFLAKKRNITLPQKG